MSVDNPSRKQLYAICTTGTVARASKGDVLSMDLSPKEDGQPVIMVTLSHNENVLLRAALPCASIAALQMYPFVTVLVRAALSTYLRTLHAGCSQQQQQQQWPRHHQYLQLPVCACEHAAANCPPFP